MTLHKTLAEILAPFELGSIPSRTDHRHFAQHFIGQEKIVDALYQRVFRTYKNKVNVFFPYQVLYSLKIVYGNIYIGAAVSGARVARSYVKIFKQGTLGDLPRERVFPAPGA